MSQKSIKKALSVLFFPVFEQLICKLIATAVTNTSVKKRLDFDPSLLPSDDLELLPVLPGRGRHDHRRHLDAALHRLPHPAALGLRGDRVRRVALRRLPRVQRVGHEPHGK